MDAQTLMLNSERIVLAFYGLNMSARATERLYRLILAWFNRLGFPPNQLGVGRKGRENSKLHGFTRANARLEKAGFAEVVDFEINSGLPNAKIPGSRFFASISFSNTQRDNYCVVGVPVESVPKKAWLPIAAELVEILDPCYGIGYLRTLERGPILYALGLNYNAWRAGMSEEEHDVLINVSRWCDMGMSREVYRDGLIRDVYPWSFLTQPQLTRPVGNATLETWIQQDSGRGRLSPMGKGVVLWEVEESNIPAVRVALQEADVIFDWRKFIKPSPTNPPHAGS